MRHRIWVLAIIAVVASAASARAQAGDEQSLKVAHETLVSTTKTGNLSLLAALIHPRSLGFFRDSQFLVQLRGDYTANEAMPAVLADLSRFVAVPTDTVYRVVGQVGVACMTANLQAKKGEKQQDRFIRATYVYVAEGGNWKLLSWHSSDTPLVKK